MKLKKKYTDEGSKQEEQWSFRVVVALSNTYLGNTIGNTLLERRQKEQGIMKRAYWDFLMNNSDKQVVFDFYGLNKMIKLVMYFTY